MGGGYIQLVALGAQDMYITGNPQISFFKAVYRRHTNFSIECIQIQHAGTISEGGGILDFKVGRHADLLYKTYLEIDFPEQPGIQSTGYINYTNSTANALIKKIDMEIGNKLIDRHYGMWYDIRNEIYEKQFYEHYLTNKQVNANTEIANYEQTTLPQLKVYLPFHFWFCNNPGLALPLIALQYHDVDFKVTYRALKHLIVGAGTISKNNDPNDQINNLNELSLTPPSIKLWANYIYLDTEERKRFAQSSHEYMIEQIQIQETNFTNNIPLQFNHSIKELFWVVQHTNVVTETTDTTKIDFSNNIPTDTHFGEHGNDYLNYNCDDSKVSFRSYLYLDTQYDHFGKCKLVVNGIDRFDPQPAVYFRSILPFNHNHRIPDKYIYMYSFAIKPEDYQPSGSFNFSKVDSASLQFLDGEVNSNYKISIFALNYNVLRIMSGMGGLLFSN